MRIFKIISVILFLTVTNITSATSELDAKTVYKPQVSISENSKFNIESNIKEGARSTRLQTKSDNKSPNIDSVATSKTAILKTLAGLGLTLLVIFGLSYLAKKIGLQNVNNNKHMQVVSSLPLGQKERAILIQVNNQTLLIGVSPGGVNLLKTIEEPSSQEQDTLSVNNNEKSTQIATDIKYNQSSKNTTQKFKKILSQQGHNANATPHQLSEISAANIIQLSHYIKRFINRK